MPLTWFGFASLSVGALQMMLPADRISAAGVSSSAGFRRWIGCSGRAFIGKGSLKRSMSVWATATGAANTFHSTTSEHGGVVSEPS